MYTVTQAARSANVSTTSIRNWAKLYADFLSPSANPPAGTPREFTAADLSVFTTVAVMRAQLVEPEAISAALDAGERLEPVRPPVEEPPADQAARAGDGPTVEARAAVAAAESAIAIYRDRVNQLEARNEALADRLIEAERRMADEKAARAAAEKELEIMRALYEAATSPTPADRRPTFWQWLTGRK
jgi:DNA-binding transcriptional MerR regulator